MADDVKAGGETRATADPVPADCRCVMIGHAVALLNNHVGVFGWGQDRADEAWRSGGGDAISALPEGIREPLVRALAGAAEMLARDFERASA